MPHLGILNIYGYVFQKCFVTKQNEKIAAIVFKLCLKDFISLTGYVKTSYMLINTFILEYYMHQNVVIKKDIAKNQ
jgi:hypothetical protein